MWSVRNMIRIEVTYISHRCSTSKRCCRTSICKRWLDHWTGGPHFHASCRKACQPSIRLNIFKCHRPLKRPCSPCQLSKHHRSHGNAGDPLPTWPLLPAVYSPSASVAWTVFPVFDHGIGYNLIAKPQKGRKRVRKLHGSRDLETLPMFMTPST